jgi:hypothetical protein
METFLRQKLKAFLKHNKAIITHLDHAKKIDYLLWSGERSIAKQFAATLTNKERALHDAYLAFLNDRPNKNELYKKVPEEYRHTSGLLYKYLEQFKKEDVIPVSAANLILKAPYDPIYHKNWWNLKISLPKI